MINQRERRINTKWRKITLKQIMLGDITTVMRILTSNAKERSSGRNAPWKKSQV
jgi:hypothetical protein